MSDTKWTPGPWAIAAGYKTMLLVESRFGGPVCDIECHCDVDTGILPSEEEEGNAHLIAAAPELYEALEAYMLMTDAPPAIASKGWSALAKARGQS